VIVYLFQVWCCVLFVRMYSFGTALHDTHTPEYGKAVEGGVGSGEGAGSSDSHLEVVDLLGLGFRV
jgi:hypothetical protein